MPGAKLLGHDGPYQLWTWDADVEEDPRWEEMQGRRIRKEQPYLHPYKRRRDIPGVARFESPDTPADAHIPRIPLPSWWPRPDPIRRPGLAPQPSRGSAPRRQVERQDDVVDPGAIGQLDEASAAPLLHEAHGPVEAEGPRVVRADIELDPEDGRGAPRAGVVGGRRRPRPAARQGPCGPAWPWPQGAPQRQHRAMGQQRGAGVGCSLPRRGRLRPPRRGGAPARGASRSRATRPPRPPPDPRAAPRGP